MATVRREFHLLVTNWLFIISVIGIMTTRGFEDAYLVDGNINGKIFLDFVQRCLLDVIQPFDEFD